MTPSKPEKVFVESTSSQDETDGHWLLVEDKINQERGELAQYHNTNMTGVLTFSGLFAAVVGAFVVESYKSLSLDPSDKTNALLGQLLIQLNSSATPVVTVDVDSFHPTRAAVLTNTLWFLALAVSLLCALLATLVQEWTRDSLRIKARSATETIQKHALKQLYGHMAIQHYGLDYIATLIVSLLHVAMILFLVGLVIFLFDTNPSPAIAVVSFSSAAALFYAFASSVRLFDPNCPYYTPLTYMFSVIIHALAVLISCITLYIVLLVDTVRAGVTKRTFTGRNLDPWLVLVYLKRPSLAARFLHRFVASIILFKSREDILRIINHPFEPPQRRRHQSFLTGDALEYIWARTGRYLTEYPGSMQSLALYQLSMQRRGVPQFMTKLRNNKSAMKKLASVLLRVDSVPAAVASARFFQMLLVAHGRVDGHLQLQSNGDWRYANMDTFYETFPVYVKNLGEQNSKALRQGVPIVVAEVSWLRWILITLIPVDTSSGSIARQKLQYFLSQLDSVDNLRMCTTSANQDGIDELFERHRDPRLELASRNALTLLKCAHRCDWRGIWRRPRYLPKGTPSLWDWRRLFGSNRPAPKPVASDCLRNLLSDERVRVSLQMDSSSMAPGDTRLRADAINALRDLATIVQSPSTADAEHAVRDVGATPQHVCYYDRPPSRSSHTTSQGGYVSQVSETDAPEAPVEAANVEVAAPDPVAADAQATEPEVLIATDSE